ncbi:50S ribosomal protein L19 [Candidatus Karelsulcia muelleri]|uniref:50S ribosomal protein L19 n=1 Tax=Candidatus Karelsulcia muelleri TaxID=336810 RepID=UPI00236445E7|nr:50S ribosomal protein L19 [Candidatus Karelsulcia muelleri]WDE42172.1 50S ribosomal protein L19 [Candidatus Karelsulcia muelleri]WDR79161.1 50S ribosomal protein L19 [Candidatus Karelsulcia muelleri]
MKNINRLVTDLKKTNYKLNSGDTVKVYYEIKEGEKKRIQSFKGIIIKKQGNSTFTVLKKIGTIGVERIFQIKSPNIKEIKKIRSVKVRRAKLYYFRNLIVNQAKRKHYITKR